ncbi:hypothetical protein IT568_03465 [bacterium]|nr:hypothetical protein [bacterium]
MWKLIALGFISYFLFKNFFKQKPTQPNFPNEPKTNDENKLNYEQMDIEDVDFKDLDKKNEG